MTSYPTTTSADEKEQVGNFVMLQIQLMQRKTKIEELGQLSACG